MHRGRETGRNYSWLVANHKLNKIKAEGNIKLDILSHSLHQGNKLLIIVSKMNYLVKIISRKL